ncbi:MAG TPA: tetratricopeptide repeat protein [Candidatus Latescibacteria bacterium]|nr:tetratricopeptide repeat protein [Candidatus Latescibacterota bacterium]
MHRETSIALVVLSVALGVVYHASFANSFHYDDFHSIVENPHIRSLARVPEFFVDPSLFSSMPERAMYRPLLLVSYALNYASGGYGLAGYHIGNWLLHLACALLVYLLGRRLHGHWPAALFAALLFGLHPITTEPVNYISSRSESQAAFFYLAALLGYLLWRQGAGRRFWLLSLIAFSCALLSKSVTVVLPVALLVYERWGHRQARGERYVFYYLPYWGVVVGYLALAQSWLGSSLGHPVRGAVEQLATQAKAAVYYVHLLIAPVRLTVEHPFSTARALGDVPVVLGIAAIASAIWFARRRPLVLLLGSWAILPLLPSSLVPLNVLVNEHRLYLPLAFLAVGVGWGVGGVWRGGRVVLVVALLAICALLTHARSLVWRDELSLWSDAAQKAPQMYRTHLHLGGALEQSGQIQAALASYDRALALALDAIEVHYNRGRVLIMLGQADAALEAYGRCLELDPNYLPAQINLAALYQDLRKLTAAEDLLRSALRIRPEEAELWRRLGLVKKKQGHEAAAAEMYARALALDPALVEARYNLGNLYRDQGRWAEAGAAFEQVLRERPDHAESYRNLGDLHLERGALQAAIEVWSRGLRELPHEVIFYYGLGQALEAQNRIEAALVNYRLFLQGGSLNPQQAAGLKRRIEELAAR